MGLQDKGERQQLSRRFDCAGRAAAAHDDPHGTALAAFDVDHHLATLPAGVALAVGGVRSDGQRLDGVVGKVGLRIEQQRALGAQPRGENLALDVAAAQNPAAAQPGRGSDAEFRVGSIGPRRGAFGFGHQRPVGLRKRRGRIVMLVTETMFLFHNRNVRKQN